MTSFSDFGLAAPIARALTEKNYTVPTPIQVAAIPPILAGRDLVGIAQTGTGKTAAFALPILNQLAARPERPLNRHVRVLILSPTRELSGQIEASFKAYGRHLPLRTELAIGGVPINRQVRALNQGADILVATPGRLIDLMRSNAVKLDRVEVFVLDEADRMLDMGFIRDIRQILPRLPKSRQTLLFSATMPGEIERLAGEMLKEPARVAVTPVSSTVERIDQRVIHIDKARKGALLADLLVKEPVERALVFTRTKHGADKVVRQLETSGIEAAAIHGNKSQGQRERALARFKSGAIKTLIATDIASRGIDVKGVSHVINYDLPNEPEVYVHRIGRTGRAGAAGLAISFCDREEISYLKQIERLTRQTIPATRADGSLVTPRPVSAAPVQEARKAEERSNEHRRGNEGKKHRRPEHRRPGEGNPRRKGPRPQASRRREAFGGNRSA